MKMYRIGFFAMVFALGAMLAATSAQAQVYDGPNAVSTRYDFSVPATFQRTVTRTTRAVAHQLQPRQVRRNAERVLRAPLDAGKWIYDGVDDAGRLLINHSGKNFTTLGCLNCGRGQREANIATNYRDCAGGDLVNNWKSPLCSKPAPAGAINSLRVWHNGAHIERVVGTCGSGLVIVADQNSGPRGAGSVRCVPVHGASYHYPLPKTGDPKVDGPFHMQKDTFCPKHVRKSA